MRVLVVHPGLDFSVSDVSRGWCRGLEQTGAQVIEARLGNYIDFFNIAHVPGDVGLRKAFDHDQAVHMANMILRSMVFDARPDVVLVVSGFFVTPATLEIIRTNGIKIALVCTESPYQDDEQVQVAAHADLVMVNDPTNIDRFREVTRTEYVPHAYDPTVHYSRDPKPDWLCDFGFVGTGYQSRVDFFDAVDWIGIDVKVGGHWPNGSFHDLLVHPADDCMNNDDTAVLYASAKLSANLYRREATRDELSVGWSMGPREVELAACGTFFLRHPRPEGDEVLPMLPTFTEPGEFGDLLRWWLAHDDARADAAERARRAVADRTFSNHAGRFLGWFD